LTLFLKTESVDPQLAEQEAPMPGSHNDAVLLVELAKWGAMIRLDEASRAVFAEDFDPTPWRRAIPRFSRS
jgi:hypothetical protein